MNKDKFVPDILKWGLVALSVFIGGQYVFPFLAKLVWDIFTIIYVGIAAAATIWLLPAIMEFVAQLSWWLFKLAIKLDPVSRAERDRAAFRGFIDSLISQKGEAETAKQSFKETLDESRGVLPPASIRTMEGNLQQLDEAMLLLDRKIDDAVIVENQMEQQIRVARVEQKLGNAFGKALKAFRFAQSSGPNSAGYEIALNTTRERMRDAQNQMKAAMRRTNVSLTQVANVIPPAQIPEQLEKSNE